MYDNWRKKISLINWINSVDDQDIINKIQKLKEESLNELPKEIIELIELSNQATDDECIKHTTTRELLNNKWKRFFGHLWLLIHSNKQKNLLEKFGTKKW